MSNLSPPSVNSKVPRKTLAEQLDRLDTIVDVLADGLNETVADVVKQAVAASLQTLLSNPDLLRNLAATVTPPLPEPLDVPEQKPGHAARLTDRLREGWEKVKTAARVTCAVVRGKVSNARKSVSGTTRRIWQPLTTAWHLTKQCRKPVVIAACVGLLVGMGSFLAGPVVAAVVSGITSTGLTLAARIL